MKKILSLALVLAHALSFGVSYSYAGPELLGVDAGSVTSETSGAVTNATASDRSISNWNFDIAAHETFNLAQPSSQAVALFRDFTGDASQIFGSLNANGQLFLINTNGILFGESASVNVGGLVASTLD
ncbi:MAG: filamentous hemagglutinin N-terminal domain-containing protein, partial [Candidatus Omnitrophota bacterium]